MKSNLHEKLHFAAVRDEGALERHVPDGRRRTKLRPRVLGKTPRGMMMQLPDGRSLELPEPKHISDDLIDVLEGVSDSELRNDPDFRSILEEPDREPETYVLQGGDSFSRLARRDLGAEASEAEVRDRALQYMELNPGDPRRLQIGAQVVVPGAGVAPSADTVQRYDQSDTELRQYYAEKARREREAAIRAAQESERRPDPERSERQPNNTTPVGLGVQWLTGRGPRMQEFSDGDPFTEMLRDHDHVARARTRIAADIRAGEDRGNEPYSLGGLEGVGNYIRDYSTLLTGGRTGNLAATYLGSYPLDWELQSTNPDGTATVSFEVNNASNMSSLSHAPVIGYTPWWDRNIGQPLNEMSKSGPMSATRQRITWTEDIPLEDLE